MRRWRRVVARRLAGEQVTQARELLRWSIVDLGQWSGVGRRENFNIRSRRAAARSADVAKIKRALEHPGVEFPEGEPPRRKAAAAHDRVSYRRCERSAPPYLSMGPIWRGRVTRKAATPS